MKRAEKFAWWLFPFGVSPLRYNCQRGTFLDRPHPSCIIVGSIERLNDSFGALPVFLILFFR